MGLVKDPVHGFIELSSLAERLVDTPEVQRLRRIKQLGLANLVYPGANHTRFEHSLGTYHLADVLCRGLGIDSDEVRAAAVLHDVGHGPLSHVSDESVKEHGGPSHEEAAREIVTRGRLAEVLEEEGLDPGGVADLFHGEGRYGEVVSSELDVDRMDYLARDAHYTGAAYGVTDYERLMHQLALVDDELVVTEGGFEAAESLLLSRFLMQPTVYRHHVSRIAKAMVKEAVSDAIENGPLSPLELRRMDDCGFFAAMTELGGLQGDTARRVTERRLYKRALWKPLSGRLEEALGDAGEVRREVAYAADVEPRRVLLDPPPSPEMEELSLKVESGGDVVPMSEASGVVAMLKEAQRESWMLGVYCPAEDVEVVGEAAERVLGD
ncbi:MAG: Deoxyguanosinetriphosphate triphosphohydrolase-like protein [Methanonatronarchaeales archaeon]|nr:Deoxyguanosinetriphosphate triphosphohydrolase-like protein [Methanonatronarchaeales archaeon]